MVLDILSFLKNSFFCCIYFFWLKIKNTSPTEIQRSQAQIIFEISLGFFLEFFFFLFFVKKKNTNKNSAQQRAD